MMLLAEEAEMKSECSLPLVEIVSHCYAAKLPQYAAMLVCQASSLVLHKPRLCNVCLSVCIWHDLPIGQEDWNEDFFGTDWDKEDSNKSDQIVRKVLPWVKQVLTEHGASWAVCHLSKGKIGRRSIGRDRLALISDADFVWFADVDQVFRDGVFDRLVSLEWPNSAAMIYPREIMIHRNHATGDKLTEAINLDDPQLIDVDPSEFVPKRYRKAIGGVQIVRGDFARKHGYLHEDKKWTCPTDKPFGDFRDDVAYRRFCSEHGSIVGVDLPGLYRIRHTRTTYQENKI